MSAVSHPGFLKFLTRFHKKSTHRNLLRTLMYKTQKDLQQRSHHARTQIPSDLQFSHSNLRKSKKNFTKTMPPLDPLASDLQNLKTSSPKVQPRTATWSHDLSNDPWPRPSNLYKSAHDFRKLTIPWSSTALNQQSPKKFETKKLPCAPTRHRSCWHHSLRLKHWHAPPLSRHAPCAYTRCTYTRALLRMTSWMTSSSTTPVWLGPTWKSDPVWTAVKKQKNKKKIKE